MAFAPEKPARGPHALELAELRWDWRGAFGAASHALGANARTLPAGELGGRATALRAEHELTARLLQQLAAELHDPSAGELTIFNAYDARRLLGLPREIRACVFAVDGVLVGSVAIHVEAWQETFDAFLRGRRGQLPDEVAPFSEAHDYRAHIHGRTRVDGVRAFLSSRGITLPEGGPYDPPRLDTVHGLANRKSAALRRLLATRRIDPYDGARRALELVDAADFGCAVVSTSAHTRTVLEQAGLAPLVDVVVDPAATAAHPPRPRPAPDLILAACELLDVAPGRIAVFETSAAGLAAARAAGARYVVAVARERRPADTVDADLVLRGLEELVDRIPARRAPTRR